MSMNIYGITPQAKEQIEDDFPPDHHDVQAFLKRNPTPHIDLQMAADDYLHSVITKQLESTQSKEDRLFKINHYLSMIEEALRKAREAGSEHIDLKKLEEGREVLNVIWEELQKDYPTLMGELDSPIPPSLNLSKVTKDQAERIINQFRNAQQRDQRALDTIARELKLAAELNELITKMTSEQAKNNPIKNMVRNQTVGVR